MNTFGPAEAAVFLIPYLLFFLLMWADRMHSQSLHKDIEKLENERNYYKRAFEFWEAVAKSYRKE